jgi:WS/DGAT/MGAT family acyltransferase
VKQLSGLDAAFLFAETRNAPMHIGGLTIWDPSTAPGGVVRFKRIIQTMVERAHLAPHTRQRLFEVPYNTDFPFWVKDASFDPEFHIRHLALPAPGDWRQLCIQVARLHARPLDRSRPLWETYIIEGLDNIEGLPPGSFAMLSKTHHACIDGKSSSDIGTALCDLSPEIQVIPGGEDWRGDIPPSSWELALKAQQHNAFKPVRYMEFLQKAIPAWVNTVQELVSGRVHGAPRVPRVRFNGSVSPHRVFEGVRYDLDDIRAIKTAAAATVNDVMLALCSGALRRYLLDKDELPHRSLVSMCPVNVRGKDTTASGGNKVASMAVALCTEVEDPKQRLLAVCEETRNAKELAHAMDASTEVEAAEFTSASMATRAARVAAEQGWANFLQPTFNTVITNVPGPQVPIYSNGARHVRGWGTGPCTDGNGLFQSIGSYCGEVTVGVTCCREMMPDPEFYAQCLDDSFGELRQALVGKARNSRRPAGKGATVKKSTRKRKSPGGTKPSSKRKATSRKT